MKGNIIRNSVLTVGLLLAVLAGISLDPHSPVTLAQDIELEASTGLQTQVGVISATPLSPSITYQGRLVKDGKPVNDTCDMKFTLWDALENGDQVSKPLERKIVVSEGLFTVDDLNFEAEFSGDARWLEVEVQCSGDTKYIILKPRQPLTAAPAALSLVLPFSAIGDSSEALISVNNTTGDGVAVKSAGHNGVNVEAAGASGVWLGSTGGDGVYVESAGATGIWLGSASEDGVYVYEAGSPSAWAHNLLSNGFEVAGSEGNGLFVGHVGARGVYVYSAVDDGVYVHSAGSPDESTPSDYKNGIEVAGAEGFGLFVGQAGSDGIYVGKTGDDGIQVQNSTGDAIYVVSAGEDGMDVSSAADIGVYANTLKVSQEWGFNTPDKIYTGGGLTSAGPTMIVVQNGSDGYLESGDLVSVSGIGAPFGESDFPTPLVNRAGAEGTTVAGVVYARFIAEEQTEEMDNDEQVKTLTSIRTSSTEGLIAPGDYLLLVVLGPAQVKVSNRGISIAPGNLLTVASEGQAMSFADGYTPGAVIGTAMEALDMTQESGLIWVLVNPH